MFEPSNQNSNNDNDNNKVISSPSKIKIIWPLRFQKQSPFQYLNSCQQLIMKSQVKVLGFMVKSKWWE